VSFFTDVSTEMIYPLLPVFLASVLGANASFIGAIEGVAETTASLLKLVSGWWSDKVGSRKLLVVVGYGIASVVRPFTAVAASAKQVLFIRLTDRIGKGIRTSPRDALLADSAPPTARGRAFGFHAAADNAGAVVGPLLAFLLLKLQGVGSFETSKRLLPHDEQAYASLTVLYLLQGRNKDAQTTVERLVSANPYRRAYNLAAQTFQELGRPEEAAAWRKRGASVPE
jgi:MFS family permease